MFKLIQASASPSKINQRKQHIQHLLNGMQSSSMTTDTSSDDEQIIVERFRVSPIARQRSWYCVLPTGELESAWIGASQGRRRRETKRLSPESTKAEIYRLRKTNAGEDITGVVWSGNGGLREGKRESRLHLLGTS